MLKINKSRTLPAKKVLHQTTPRPKYLIPSQQAAGYSKDAG